MKNLMIQAVTLHRLAARLVAIVLFAALLSATPFQAAFAQAPSLGSAGSFAVLSAAPAPGGAVTLTTSTVNGDVGSSGPMASVVQTGSTITGAVIAPVPVLVLTDFNSAYDALALVSCDTVLTGTLAGVTLAPGVYCFDAAATVTGQLTLSGPSNGIWIFQIGTSGTGALTGTNFSVVMEGGGSPCNVYWWVAEAATMTTSGFQGTILAGAAIDITGLAVTPTTTSFNGDALAKAAVTLTDVTVVGCISPVPQPDCKKYCKDYCKDYWQEYWKEYWKDHDKYHCKDHEKDYCKHHYCTNHDKDRCKDHDKDNYKNKDNDKDNRNRR